MRTENSWASLAWDVASMQASSISGFQHYFYKWALREGSAAQDKRPSCLTRNLLLSHTGYEICFAELKRMGRVQTRKHIKGTRDKSRPSSLMTGTKTGPIVAMEILVEQDYSLSSGSRPGTSWCRHTQAAYRWHRGERCLIPCGQSLWPPRTRSCICPNP